MAGEKFIKINTTTGNLEEDISTQVGGGGNENKIVSLDANGKLDSGMMPTGFGDDVNTVIAGETLNAGDFVNVYYDGVDLAPRCRKADATTEGKEANGFVLDAVTDTQAATVYFEGTNTALSALDDGKVHFLSTTPGQASSTVPTGSGNVVQRLGRSISDTVIAFENSQPIKLV